MKRKIVDVGIVLCLTVALVWMGRFSATDAKTSQNESEIYTYADASDGSYLVIQASGRKWTECRIVDTASWKELSSPDVVSICALTEDFPDIYENGITAVRPKKWLSGDTLLLEVYWDGAPFGDEAVTGTVEYEVDTGSYREFDLQLESVG